MELEDPKDLQARFRKFLNLTNERIKMSKTTLRKRISLTVVTALAAGVLTSVAGTSVANAHGGSPSTSATNVVATTGTVDASLFVAESTSTSGQPVIGNTALGGALVSVAAKSLGLLAKDTSSGIAQTATVLAGGSLSMYAFVSTSVGVVVSGGTLNSGASIAGAATYGQDLRSAFIGGASTATSVAIIWTAPTTAGTYTISTYRNTVASSDGTNTVTLATPSGGTLSGRISVSVVAASVGGTVSPIYSVCNTSTVTTRPNLGATISNGEANVDSTATVINGGTWYINMRLADAYTAPLDNGNIVVTATNGAFVNYSEGGTAVAGTGSTVVAFANARDAANPLTGGSVTVTQPTANAPITTTVTVSYNGTTVCTKTVTIRGEVAKIAVSNIITQDLSLNTGVANASWIDDTSGRAGLFTVLATDSAGNQVATSGVGTFASSAASLAGQTIVTALSVDNSATATSSTSPSRYSTGIFTCGAVAGDVKTARLTFTNSGSATVVTSDAFTLRCADDPYTYTASWDKASYVQGEIATLTVKFLDSKGFAANNRAGLTGGWTGSTPMLQPISATGAAPVLDNNGTKTYTYSVGGSVAITAGSYVSVIEFPSLTNGTKQTPSYKVSTGGDTTSNADVLKSIVALIASINKQIQALQKLILRR
jgi:hypothetical protein